jgi:hypothetical protein
MKQFVERMFELTAIFALIMLFGLILPGYWFLAPLALIAFLE